MHVQGNCNCKFLDDMLHCLISLITIIIKDPHQGHTLSNKGGRVISRVNLVNTEHNDEAFISFVDEVITCSHGNGDGITTQTGRKGDGNRQITEICPAPLNNCEGVCVWVGRER